MCGQHIAGLFVSDDIRNALKKKAAAMTTPPPPDYTLRIGLDEPIVREVAGVTFRVRIRFGGPRAAGGTLLIFADKGSEVASKIEAWLWTDSITRLLPGSRLTVTLRAVDDPLVPALEYPSLDQYLGLTFDATVIPG